MTSGDAGAGSGVAARSSAERDRHAASFGAVAAAYAQSRPAYPDEAVDWLVEGVRSVLDLGAGTGALTRQLVSRGLDVVAVEPSAGMREQLALGLPDVDVRAGTAEETGLADSSVDAVVLAQAWHWVDPSRAVPEMARILRPAGRLGLVWNIRDERVPWVAELGDLLESAGRERPDNAASHSTVAATGAFSAQESLEVPWQHALDVEGLVDLVASRSFVILLDPTARAALLEQVRQLGMRQTRGGSMRLQVPYVTRCWRTRRV